MAIAFDASSISANPGDKTFSHTCTGTNLILIVGVYDGFNGTLDYNGVSMTQLGTWQNNTGLFYLINPATGTHTVTLTTSNSGTTFRMVAASYTGVKQTGFPDSSATGNSTSNPVTPTTTVVASNCWVVGVVNGSGSGHYTSNKTDRREGFASSAGAGSISLILSDTNGTVATGSQGITFSGATGDRQFIFSMEPAGSASFPAHVSLLGVGK